MKFYLTIKDPRLCDPKKRVNNMLPLYTQVASETFESLAITFVIFGKLSFHFFNFLY